MKKNYLFLFVLFIQLIHGYSVSGQKKSVAELLGYPEDAKLLIIHADDIGVSHSENIATISAYEKGAINSGSIMVPCPWFPEIAAYAGQHPEFDLGLHLTLTSEWKYFRWDGVMPSSEIPSLVNKEGYFYETVDEVVKNANTAEIEKELRAQIDRAIAFGIKPTHLDPHMGTLFSTPELFKIYLEVGKEYRMPVLVPLNWLQGDAKIMKLADDYPVKVKEYIQLTPGVPADRWQQAYDEAIKQIKPGLNELVIHLAYDNVEMQAVTIGKTHWWDAAWRQRDYDYVISQRFKDALRQNDIRLVTWRQIQKAMYP